MQIHGKIIKKYKDCSIKKLERFNKALPILHRYFNDDIGRAECLTLMGYSTNNHTTMPYMIREYRKQFKVAKDYRNTVDIQAAQPQRRETYNINRQAKTLDSI
ncbi:MAG TPA: hypothetical protein VFD03_06210 [Clostridia bacterium]|nr:hypothetical protein [Clostridia bacterium]